MPDKDPQSPNDTYYATVTAHDVDGYPADGGKDFSTRVDALESYYGFDEETSKVSLVNVASENKLFVKFVSEDGEQSSEEYRISSIIKNTDNNEHYYKIKIDGIFSDDIAFIGTSSSSVDHLLRFRKKEVDWEKRDHALFVGYAPSVKPKYAISVVIEHGGSGASTAAPIAKAVFKFINSIES